jgi:hypothetical protein
MNFDQANAARGFAGDHGRIEAGWVIGDNGGLGIVPGRMFVASIRVS